MSNLNLNYSDISTDEDNDDYEDDDYTDSEIDFSTKNEPSDDEQSDYEDVSDPEEDAITMSSEMLADLNKLSRLSSYKASKEFPLSRTQKASRLLHEYKDVENKLGRMKPYQYEPESNKLLPVINVDIANDLLTNLPGINVLGVSAYIHDDEIDLDDLLVQEFNESPRDFEARRRLTIQLANIQDFKLNNVSALVAGKMILKKINIGISYSDDIENVLNQLLSMIE